MSTPDAIVRPLNARYCARIKAGTPVPPSSRMPVQRQSPGAGSTGHAWSTVTLTIGIPTRPGTPKHVKFNIVTDTLSVRPVRAPCPAIRLTGETG